MSLIELRNAFWSDICAVDPAAYSRFVALCMRYGCSTIKAGGGCRTAGDVRDGRSCSNFGHGYEPATDKFLLAPACEHMAVPGVTDSSVAAEGVGVGCIGGQSGGNSFSGVAGDFAGNTVCGVAGIGDDGDFAVKGGIGDAALDGGPVEVKYVVGGKTFDSKTQRNREWRRLRKEKRDKRKSLQSLSGSSAAGGFWNMCTAEVRQKLIDSKAEMHVAANDLSVERDRRKLQVLKANDVSEEVNRYRTSVRSVTERNMVSIEKTHSALSASGNCTGGFAETLVGSNSISPDSSASSKEFFECKKAFLDSEKKLTEEKNRVELLIATLVDAGIDVPELGRKEYHELGIFTDNSENRALFDDYSAVVEESASLYGLPGKVKFTPV